MKAFPKLPLVVLLATTLALFFPNCFRGQVSAFNHELEAKVFGDAIELGPIGGSRCNGNQPQAVAADEHCISGDNNSHKSCICLEQPVYESEITIVSKALASCRPDESGFVSISIDDDNSTSIQIDDDSELDLCPICMDDLDPVNLTIWKALSNRQIQNYSLASFKSFLTQYNSTDYDDEMIYFHLSDSQDSSNNQISAPREAMAQHRAHRKCVRCLIANALQSTTTTDIKCPFCNSIFDVKDIVRQALVEPETFSKLMKAGLVRLMKCHIMMCAVWISIFIVILVVAPKIGHKE